MLAVALHGRAGRFLDRLRGLEDIEAGMRAEIAEWAQHLRVIRGLADRSAELYALQLARFGQWCTARGLALDTLTSTDIETWQRDLFVAHASPSTRVLALTSVRRFFVWRELTRGIRNPAAPVPAPKRAKRVPKKYNDDQLRAMFAAANRNTMSGRRAFALLMFLYGTGARHEECALLTLSQLELGERTGRVRFFGKGAKERVVPFERPVVEALSAWLHDRDELAPDHEFVWCQLRSNKGTAITVKGLAKMFDTAARRAGLRREKGMHKMRVTFATDLYDACGDIELVRLLMGHESIETTRRYIAISNRRLKTRLPAQRIDELTGDRRHATPLWLQNKLKRRAAE